MSRLPRIVRGERQKELVRTFDEACGRHNRWQVWSDAMVMYAISISNTVDKDGTELELIEFALPMHAVAHYGTKEEALSTWDLLTQENLAAVQIRQNGDVLVAFQYAGLTGVQHIINDDGTITTHFYMQGEWAAHPDEAYISAAKILLGEEQ